jgi:hypothetical protein
MQRCSSSSILAIFLLALLSACLATGARSQSLDSVLNNSDKAGLDLAASHVVQKIQESKGTDAKPTVLVIDFFRGSAGTSSLLGTSLADHFSASLNNFTSRVRILDRNLLKDFLMKEWTSLDSLQSDGVCLGVGHEIGATGVITGKVHEENGFIPLRIHLEGFGPAGKDDDLFRDNDEIVRLTETEQLRDMFYHRGPNYARNPDPIPEEPGVLQAGVDGPECPLACTVRPRSIPMPPAPRNFRASSLSLSSLPAKERRIQSMF